jgi:flavin-dependent dehydrogenase
MQVLSKAKKNNDYSEKNLSEYDRLLWGEVGKELKTSARLQNLGRSSFLLNFVINRAARSNEVQDIMAGMLSHEIPKSELSKPSFYFKILFS